MEIDLDHLHHAYLLVGNQESAETLLHTLFPQLVGSPDYFVSKESTFGIDASRSLSVMAARKGFVGKKIFFIAPETITPEAQNALLKTFEEPVPETHFFLSVRDEGSIIPTLRSRMLEVRIKGEGNVSEEAEKFLALPLKERLAFVKKFVDREENVSTLLDNLLLATKSEEVRKNLYKMRLVSDQRGASPRLILEHLALVL